MASPGVASGQPYLTRDSFAGCAAVLIKRARAACRWRCRFLYQFGSAGSRKTKMDTPHAAMKLERFEGFRDRSVARETCLDGHKLAC